MRTVMPASDCTNTATEVRSAWDARLFAERVGGWPIVLRRVGGTSHQVGSPAEAADILEAGDADVWMAEAPATTWRSPRPTAVR